MAASGTPDPAATTPFARRAVAAARRGGARELWWRSLGVTVFRRLIVHTRTLHVASPDAHVPGLEIGEVHDSATYATLRPAVPATEFDARRARGDRCGGAWLDGALVSVRWMALGRARLDYLDLDVALQPGVAYYYDGFTAPELQGRGIGMAMSRELDARLRERGAHTMFGAILPENAAGMALVRASPHLRATGWIGVVRAGRRRIPVNRAPRALVAGVRHRRRLPPGRP